MGRGIPVVLVWKSTGNLNPYFNNREPGSKLIGIYLLNTLFQKANCLIPDRTARPIVVKYNKGKVLGQIYIG